MINHAVIHAVVKLIKAGKKITPERDSNPRLCDATAVFY